MTLLFRTLTPWAQSHPSSYPATGAGFWQCDKLPHHLTAESDVYLSLLPTVPGAIITNMRSSGDRLPEAVAKTIVFLAFPGAQILDITGPVPGLRARRGDFRSPAVRPEASLPGSGRQYNRQQIDSHQLRTATVRNASPRCDPRTNRYATGGWWNRSGAGDTRPTVARLDSPPSQSGPEAGIHLHRSFSPCCGRFTGRQARDNSLEVGR